jgi:hypothetical protein
LIEAFDMHQLLFGNQIWRLARVVALSFCGFLGFAAIVRADLIGTAIQSGDSGPVFSYPGGIEIATFQLSGPSLLNITGMEIEFTLDDGDSAIGEPDHNDLVLFLNGIDTGVRLNGFSNGDVLNQIFTASIDPNTVGASLLASLGPNNTVVATIVDLDNDLIDPDLANPLLSNIVTLPSVNFGQNVIARLELYGVPEPSSVALMAIATSVGGMAWLRKRKPKRRQLHEVHSS